MRLVLSLALSAILGSCALAQAQPDPRGGGGRGTQPPPGGTRGGGGFGGSFGGVGGFGGSFAPGPGPNDNLERRLASLEAQSDALLRQIKALRAELGKPENVKVIPLKHMKAGDSSKLLNDIFAKDGLVRVFSDDRTNSLLISAPKDWMEVVQTLVGHLDIEKR